GEQVVEPPAQELDGFVLDLPLPLLINVENGARARAEAAVVEEGHAGTQEELLARARPGEAKIRIVHAWIVREGGQIGQPFDMISQSQAVCFGNSLNAQRAYAAQARMTENP